MITPYVASPWSALSNSFQIPKDTASDKLILSVHAYTPYPFAMQDKGGKRTFTNSHKSEINNFMSKLYNSFVEEHNIPVVIGEYGATNKNNLTDRENWFSYFVEKAHSYGMCPILWDNGAWEIPANGSYEELYGYYNRMEQTWYFPTLIKAIINN